MKTRVLKLRCRDGHWEWGTFTLRQLPSGFGLVAACDLGDHWLAEYETDAVIGLPHEIVVRSHPYPWPTPEAAYAALARYEAQEHQQ